MSPPDTDAGRIELFVPMDPRFGATVRLLAASLAADAGFTVDEIDDLRLGISEAFSLVVDRQAARRVRVAFAAGGGAIDVEIGAEGSAVTVEPDELARTVLRSVVDRCEFVGGGVVLRKTATEAAGRGA